MPSHLPGAAPLANDFVLRAPDYRPGDAAVHTRDAVRLCSNENPYGDAQRLRELWSRAADLHIGHYPDNGYPALHQALARLHGLAPDHVLVGNGSSELLTLVARAYLGPGRTAVRSSDSFALFSVVSRLVGAEVAEVPSVRYGHDAGALAAASARAQVLFIDNPCNPTGRYLPAAEVEALLRATPRSVLVVVDEAYAEYVTAPDYGSCTGLVGEFPNLLIVRTLSKAYGLAGLRVGYCIGSPAVLRMLERLRPPFSVNSFAAQVALAALADQRFVADCRTRNEAERRRIESHPRVAACLAAPGCANFVFLHSPHAARLHARLKEHGVHVLAFPDAPSYLRVTVGTREENQRFLDAFEAAARDLDRPHTRHPEHKEQP
ncbi:histidinol-phosphate transaminase [Ramlibacter sp.]|uniref:histidinol-phosphate transaminase n=1 Tax=Ramlibacter sp. TaxID=1917967 RepID=UPI0017A64E3B|nr:histidinol-phosphate transaminase [Ramlibacter sp.]MBA2675453.1 histidinol-phosphate transaminase [Ramlibacter sp.]